MVPCEIGKVFGECAVGLFVWIVPNRMRVLLVTPVNRGHKHPESLPKDRMIGCPGEHSTGTTGGRSVLQGPDLRVNVRTRARYDTASAPAPPSATRHAASRLEGKHAHESPPRRLSSSPTKQVDD